MTHPAQAQKWPITLPNVDGVEEVIGRGAVRMVRRERITAALWNLEHCPGQYIDTMAASVDDEWAAYAAFEQAEIKEAVPA